MAATLPRPEKAARAFPRRLAWLLAPLALVAAACWWLTAPLDEPAPAGRPGPVAEPPGPAPEPAPVAKAGWPEGTLDGEPAKQILLDTLLEAEGRLREVDGYTATFRKQERIGGRLGPEQAMAMKVRNRPFAIYFKFLSPKAGKEVVFAEGRHGGKLIAHNGDWTRRLIPRLAVSPTDRIALADSRHPITEAGLVHLTEKLVGYRRLDLKDPEAVTILDRTTDDAGRPRLRSVHTHPDRNPDRPFARVEVLYDPETKIPVSIASYDWPEPGDDELRLAERYTYDDLALDARLTDLDFDPANPEYAFHRY